MSLTHRRITRNAVSCAAMLDLDYPIVQLALDYASIDDALKMADIGVRAGVDILEAGTPLIVAQGASCIGRLKQAFPDYVVLADYKTMDSGFKNVQVTQAQGGQIMTVCANAADETVQSAIAEGKKTGIKVVADTIGCKDQAARAAVCAQWGVDLIYLHYAADQWRADPRYDATQWLASVLPVVGDTPVGLGTFGVEDAVRGVQMGAKLVAIGHPIITGPEPEKRLAEFVREVKSRYQPWSS